MGRTATGPAGFPWTKPEPRAILFSTKGRNAFRLHRLDRAADDGFEPVPRPGPRIDEEGFPAAGGEGPRVTLLDEKGENTFEGRCVGQNLPDDHAPQGFENLPALFISVLRGPVG